MTPLGVTKASALSTRGGTRTRRCDVRAASLPSESHDGQLTLSVDEETITLGPEELSIVTRGRVRQPSNNSA
jgi:hypothetical protein